MKPPPIDQFSIDRSPIESVQNSHVAAARALHTRKGRTAASAFLIEGPHAVAAALAAPRARVRELFVTVEAAQRERELMRAAAGAGTSIRTVTDRVLAALGDTVSPQGVVAIVDIAQVALAEICAINPRLMIVLERIADPGNAGTVIRTADAAGADAVVATAGSVDLWSGKSVRSSAGSVLHLPLVSGAELRAALTSASAAGCMILATAADGTTDLDDLIDSGALAVPTAWVFGNEAHGVSDEVRAAADHVVRLPVYGQAESLNLAAAAAICLYASARAQRGTSTTRSP